MKKHCVYFLTNGVNVKVGCTSNYNRRKSSLKYRTGCELRLAHIVRGMSKEQAFSLEAAIHTLLDSKKLGGEWFRFDFSPVKIANEAIACLSSSDWFDVDAPMCFEDTLDTTM